MPASKSVKLLHGDCLEEMGKLAPGSVDLTVTSPPYDNLRTYNGSLNDWTPAKWQAIIAELYRVTKDGGVVVWVVGDATINGSETGTSFRQALHAMACGFRLHDTMIYEKPSVGGARGSLKAYNQTAEFMFVWAKGQLSSPNIIRDVPNKNAGRLVWFSRGAGESSPGRKPKPTVCAAFGRRGNVWRIETVKGNNNGHPAPFPEALARDHILSWSNEGDTVLDPFLGSGTTGKMAVLHNRSFIGIERDAAYFAIAEKRLASAVPVAAAA